MGRVRVSNAFNRGNNFPLVSEQDRLLYWHGEAVLRDSRVLPPTSAAAASGGCGSPSGCWGWSAPIPRFNSSSRVTTRPAYTASPASKSLRKTVNFTGVLPTISPSSHQLARGTHSRTPSAVKCGLRVRLEHQLRNHHFPGVAAKSSLVLRLRALSVPRGHSQHLGKLAPHPWDSLETACKPTYHIPIGIQQVPSGRPTPYMKGISRRQIGDSTVHEMIRSPIPCEAQKYVASN